MDTLLKFEASENSLVREQIALARFEEAAGFDAARLDLSVDPFTARNLARSGFVGMVRIRFDSNISIHQEVFTRLETYLEGRNPCTRMVDQELRVDFPIASIDDGEKARVAEFGYTLALLIGGIPQVRVVGRK